MIFFLFYFRSIILNFIFCSFSWWMLNISKLALPESDVIYSLVGTSISSVPKRCISVRSLGDSHECENRSKVFYFFFFLKKKWKFYNNEYERDARYFRVQYLLKVGHLIMTSLKSWSIVIDYPIFSNLFSAGILLGSWIGSGTFLLVDKKKWVKIQYLL